MARSGRKWFDCAMCHQEQENHPLLQTFELTFACKKCKKCFRKDVQEFEDCDEYCPRCDNHFVIDAQTPKLSLNIEGEDMRVDARMLKDDRLCKTQPQLGFHTAEAADRLG